MVTLSVVSTNTSDHKSRRKEKSREEKEDITRRMAK